jgi:hypothetical protein
VTLSDEPPGGSGDDPFEGLTLDDAWARGAAVREPSARSRSLQADLLRIDAEEAERAVRTRRSDRRRRRKRRSLVVLVLVAFVAAVAIADHDGGGGSGAPTWASGADGKALVATGSRPTPSAAASDAPLGEPADPDADGGTFAFLETGPDGTTPVTYDPCRPIEIVVDDRTAPDGGEELVEEAVAAASKASGLEMTVTGTTDERPVPGRPAYQPDRYGDRWAPVLVAWSDPDEFPALDGDVVGIGGSASVEPASGARTYVTGMVVLDGPDLKTLIGGDGGERVARDVVEHELGHLLGLAHVDDASELMYPEGRDDLHNYQEGDLTGLSRLGQGPCINRL